jgi:hypothetical protein
MFLQLSGNVRFKDQSDHSMPALTFPGLDHTSRFF